MSTVTNVILSFAVMDDGSAGLDDREAFGGACFHRVQLPPGTGKVLETEIAVAAVNHLDEEVLIARLRSIPWTYPQEVQLFVKRQDDDRFTEIPVFEVPL